MVSTESPVMMMPSYGNGDGCMGGQWIWAIVLMALLGNGNWGNRGNCGDETWKATEFNQLSGMVRANANGLADASFALNNSIKDGNFALQREIDQLGTQMGNAFCTTTYELSNRINDLGAQVQQGFCQTNFNNQQNTNAIVNAVNCGNQRIIDWLCCNEKQQLNKELAEKNQLLSEARIVNAITQNSCNCGNGCGFVN